MTVYHTATKEDYDALMVELEGKGYRWNSWKGPAPTKLEHDRPVDNIGILADYYGAKIIVPLSINYLKRHVGKFGEIIEYKTEKKLSFTEDIINKPSHYHKNNIDVIGFAEAQFSKEEQKGFHRINAIKYITRYDRKNGVEDLNKAKFYIDKLIEMEESE